MTSQEANIEKNLTEFYKYPPSNDYAQLKSYAHLCKKTFSKVKCVKFHYRSELTDEHLQLILMGNTKTLNPPNEVKCYPSPKESHFY